MILQYEGLSAINNIKYHDITLWRAVSNKQTSDITILQYKGLSAINNIKSHDITL